jgi:SAM-dependent methyltransferase
MYTRDYFHHTGSSQGGYWSYLDNEAGWRRMARRKLTLIRRSDPTGHVLLDVGSATGFFVHEAGLAGWEATGIEPSSWAASYARDQLGVGVVQGTLDDAPMGEVDVLTAWEVIEHVTNPYAFLRSAHRLLRPNGTLELSTPVTDTLVPRVLGRHWIGWDKVPEHQSFFSRRSLDTLLARSGFRVHSRHLTPISISLAYLLDRLWVQATGQSRNFAQLPFANRTVSLNPGWDLTVIVRPL